VIRSIDLDLRVEWARTPQEAGELFSLRAGAYQLFIHSELLMRSPAASGIMNIPCIVLGRKVDDLSKPRQKNILPPDFDLIAARRLIEDLLPAEVLAQTLDGAFR
jgi:hypothetical protein